MADMGSRRDLKVRGAAAYRNVVICPPPPPGVSESTSFTFSPRFYDEIFQRCQVNLNISPRDSVD